MKLAKHAKTMTMGMAAAAVIAVVGFAATSYAKPPGGGGGGGGKGCGPDACLDVWQPVICSDGQIYSNYCYAAKACATGCVPYGDI
ncbi:MAG: hypothetical protein IT436_13695 [Phycisphaerales bacterium]|nr:hypothetical protein [Phycisphaerales bacterium]